MSKAKKYKVNATFTFEDKEWGRSIYGTSVEDCDSYVECWNVETG
jgi:hypothetical protein